MKMLVGIDFSPPSAAALKQALWLAERTGAAITVAHVLSDIRTAMLDMPTDARWQLVAGDVDSFARSLRSKSNEMLDALVVRHRARGINIRRMTLLGAPSVELIHAVLKEHYDLVATGAKRQGAVKRIPAGSTAENLVRKCPAPVWIVKDAAPLRVIIAPVDFSADSAKALRLAGVLAQEASAKLIVLHAIAEREQLDEIIAQNVDASVATYIQFIDKGVPAAIAVAAKRLGADLIVMASVSRVGLPGYLFGNMAEKMLRSTACSMLIIKPDGFVSPIDPPFWKMHPDEAPTTP